MSELKFMSDQRQGTLVKAAEECIDLMNVGVEPNAALRKVAKDFSMNDKEVVLVSHAVNNSKQLAHLQTAKPMDKEAPFLLTNAEKVVGVNDKGDQDEVAHPEKLDQPDGLDTQKKLKKAAESYAIKNMRTLTPDVGPTVAELRENWGIGKVAEAPSEGYNPYDSLSELKHAAAEAGQSYRELQDNADAILDKVAEAFTYIDAPSFEEFEKAASQAGITEELIDIIYDRGPAQIGVARPVIKVAEADADKLYVAPVIFELVKAAQHADEMWQAAADNMTARDILLEKIADGENEMASSFRQAGEDLGDVVGFGESPSEYLTGASGVEVPGSDKPFELDNAISQQLTNSKAKTHLATILRDPFISKHNLPDVVAAYNRAMSVNPKFGEAEIGAFVKQDLASKGAVPLDLMVRSSQSHRSPIAG